MDVRFSNMGGTTKLSDGGFSGRNKATIGLVCFVESMYRLNLEGVVV